MGPPYHPRYFAADDATVDWCQLCLLLRYYLFHQPGHHFQPFPDLAHHDRCQRAFNPAVLLHYREVRSPNPAALRCAGYGRLPIYRGHYFKILREIAHYRVQAYMVKASVYRELYETSSSSSELS